MRYSRLLLFFFLLGFTSCIPYKEIDIQYLNKPEEVIPSDFSKPLILINSYAYRGNTKKDKFEYALDSVASQEAALSLKENLLNSPWFENLTIPIRNNQRVDNSKYIKPLTWNDLTEIASKDTADLVISLEYMKVMVNTDSYRTRNNEIEYYYGYLSMPVYCYWRVYDLAKKQIPSGYLYQDTLFWDTTDWIPVGIGNQLPGYFSASAYAGGDSGEKYARKITPVWNDDKRIFFHSGSKEMDKAALYAIKGLWIDAASEWQKVFALNKNKLSAKAAFNLALANEMLGKFDISMEWLRKSKKYYPLPEIDDYKATIEERINTGQNK